MARKARTVPRNEPDLPVETAPAPRRGCKPKVAMPMSKPVLPDDDNGAGADAAASIPPVADSPPTRRRSGCTPRGLEEAAAVSLVEQALEQQPEADVTQPMAAGDDAMIAEMAYPVSAGEDGNTPVGDAAPPQAQNTAVPDASSFDAPASAKPAAHWDRVTNMVQFDWPAIERTAAQDGPNQAMAKLLVAARAEGANSRWPL